MVYVYVKYLFGYNISYSVIYKRFIVLIAHEMFWLVHERGVIKYNIDTEIWRGKGN